MITTAIPVKPLEIQEKIIQCGDKFPMVLGVPLMGQKSFKSLQIQLTY